MAKPIVLFIELKIASKNKYVCDITEKLFLNKISVNIYANAKNTLQLDNLLWTWKQESFIPHVVNDGQQHPNGHVIISTSEENLVAAQAVILHDPLPAEVLQNYRLIIDFAEIYHSDKKIESRKRYKALQESGNFDIHFTQLGALLAKKSIDLSRSF
jgi:DNA polymerase IIIc chi subunit